VINYFSTCNLYKSYAFFGFFFLLFEKYILQPSINWGWSTSIIWRISTFGSNIIISFSKKFLFVHFHLHVCRNPTLAKCGGEARHLEKLEVWSPLGLPNVQSSTERPKTPCIKVFLVSLRRSWNVDIENGLALAIRTSAAQVMGERRARSQTGSLTPDH
jgi:hypothetical protein